MFDESVVATNQPTFELESFMGVSRLRDTVVKSGTADHSMFEGEIALSTGADALSSISITTNEKGRYQAGTQGETGMGVRLSGLPVDDQVARWGYFDERNGMGWGVDSTGLFVFVRRAGQIVHKTYQSFFSENKLDGSGAYGVQADLLGGHIFLIDFTWYGYGSFNWIIQKQIKISEFESYMCRHIAHLYDPAEDDNFSGASLESANLPIRAEVENGNSGGDLSLFMGGSKFSIIGGFRESSRRNVADTVEGYSLTVSQGEWEPILALRPRDFFNGIPNPVNVRLEGASF